MRGIKDKGLEDLKDFRNRLYKSRGMGRISEEDFQEVLAKTLELIEITESIEEQEE